MAAEKLVGFIGPQSVEELSIWAGNQGLFVATGRLKKGTGFIAGVGSDASIEVGDAVAATDKWVIENAIVTAIGKDEGWAIRNALEKLRKKQYKTATRRSQVIPKNVVEFKPRKSA